MYFLDITNIINFYSCHLGYGGGYNEREGVEYIKREDSDDEFDEVRSEVKKSAQVLVLSLVFTSD